MSRLLGSPLVTVWAQAAKQPVWDRLAPTQRAKLLMALLGLILVGVMLALMVVAGGRLVRRLARHRPASKTYEEDEWLRRGDIEARREKLRDDHDDEDAS